MNKSRPLSMHLFPAFLLIVIVVALIIYLNSATQFRTFYQEKSSHELQIRARMFSANLTDCLNDNSSVDSLADAMGEMSDTRFTVINREGEVLADSRNHPDNMDNHGDRPEVIAALNGEIHHAIRYSETMKVDFMYVAIPADSLVIRTSIPLTDFSKALDSYKNRVIKAVLIASIVAILLSLLLTRVISRPIEDLKQRALHLAEGKFTPTRFLKGSSEIEELSDIMEHSSQELEKRFRMISHQKERLRVVLSRMVEGVIALDSEEKVFLVNDAAKRMLNIDAGEIKGHWIQELVRNVPFQQTVNELLSNKKDLSAHISVPTDGDPRILSLSGRILENDGGCLIVLHDITDLKRLENLRRDFAGNVSHELRTPLTSIKGFVETLMDGAINDPGDAVHFLGIINKQVDRLNNLIEDLLTIARLEKEEETGGIDITLQEIKPIADLAIAGCLGRADKKSISVNLEIEDEKIQGEVSDSLLHQAFSNLIDNAIKYSGPESTVTVKVSNSSEYLTLAVSDEGPGIPREHLGRLFERFYRVDKARSSSMGGTGLGLSIVKHIAGVHNGTVSVESTVGEGSTFSLLLPKKEA